MAFEMFQVYSSSTQTLSREISSNRREGVSISVLPNFLPPTFALRAQLVRRSRKYGTSTIGYFGGFSHQPELDAVGPILRSYLRKTKRKILINAQLSFDSSGIESQVRFFNPLPLDEAWRFYESVDVAIAPLLPGDFNQSKSAVKLMEAVVHGVPLVGSPNSDYPRLTSPLLFEVREDNEWQSALDSAIATNPTARRDAGAEMGNLAGLEAFTELSMRPFLESLGI
jgi:glycosyltransferase involved in cell wall biosynthesis